MTPTRPPFVLPSVSPEPIPWDDALATVPGHARAKRPLTIRTPSHPDGHVVDVPAHSYSVYGCVPTSDDDGFAWLDFARHRRPQPQFMEVLRRAGGRTHILPSDTAD